MLKGNEAFNKYICTHFSPTFPAYKNTAIH